MQEKTKRLTLIIVNIVLLVIVCVRTFTFMISSFTLTSNINGAYASLQVVPSSFTRVTLMLSPYVFLVIFIFALVKELIKDVRLKIGLNIAVLVMVLAVAHLFVVAALQPIADIRKNGSGSGSAVTGSAK